MAIKTMRIGDNDFATDFVERDSRYTDSNLWMARRISEMMSTVGDAPMYADAIAQKFQGSSPDAIAAITAVYGNPNDPAVQALVSADQIAQEQTPPQEDWSDTWPMLPQIKGAVRTGFAAMSYPVQKVQMGVGLWDTALADLRDAAFGGGNEIEVDYGQYAFDLFAPGAGTTLGAMAEDYFQDGSIDTGDSWVGVDEDSTTGHIERQHAYERARILVDRGEDKGGYRALGAGGSMVYLYTGSLAGNPIYNLGSGVIDGIINLGGDPLNLLGVGPFSKAGRLGQAAAKAQNFADAGAAMKARQATDDAVEAQGEVGRIEIQSENARQEFEDTWTNYADEVRAEAESRRPVAAQFRRERIATEASKAGNRSAEQAARWRTEAAEATRQGEGAAAMADEVETLSPQLLDDVSRYTPGPVRLGGPPSPMSSLDDFLDADPEIVRLSDEFEAALRSGDSNLVDSLGQELEAAEQAARRRWADETLADDAAREEFLTQQGFSRNLTDEQRAGLRAEYESEVGGAAMGFASRGLDGYVSDPVQPLGLSRIQENIWRGQGKISFAWAQRNFDSAEEFWSWFHTGNPDIHRSLEDGVRESFRDTFGDAPGWTEVREMFSPLGRSRTQYIEVPWAGSNRGFEDWLETRLLQEEDDLLQRAIDSGELRAWVTEKTRTAPNSVEYRAVPNEAGGTQYVIYHRPTNTVIDVVDNSEEAAILRTQELSRMPAYAEDATDVEPIALAAARIEEQSRRLAQIAAEAGLGNTHDYNRVAQVLRRRVQTARATAERATARADEMADSADARARNAAEESAAAREAEYEQAVRDYQEWIAGVREEVSAFRTRVLDEATRAADDLNTRADEAERVANERLEEARKLTEFALGDEVDETATAEDLMEAILQEKGDWSDIAGDAVASLGRIIGEKNRDRLLFILSQMTSPSQIIGVMGGRRISAEVAQALAKAKTPEEVASVLAVAYSDGNIALDALQRLKGFLPRTMLTRLVNAGAKADVKPIRSIFASKINEAAFATLDDAKVGRILWQWKPNDRKTPWSYNVRSDDTLSIAMATRDWIRWSLPGRKYAAVREKLAREYADRILAADTTEERWAAFQDSITAVSDEILSEAKKKGMNKDDFLKFRDTLKAQMDNYGTAMTEARNYNAQVLANGGGKIRIGVDGELDVTKTVNAIYELADEFSFPGDPQAIRRIARALDSRDSKPAKIRDWLADATEATFDRAWRIWTLVRIAFVLRNAIDVQFRAYLSGYYTNPLEAVAMTLASHGRLPDNKFGRLLADMAWGDKNILDENWTRFSDLDSAADAMFDVHYVDGMGGAATSMFDAGMRRASRSNGAQDVAFSAPSGANGWAQEILRIASDPVMSVALSMRLGRTPTWLANEASRMGVSVQEALVRSIANPESQLGRQGKRLVDAWRRRAADQEKAILEKQNMAAAAGREYTPTADETSFIRLVAEFDTDPIRAWGDMIENVYMPKFNVLLLGDDPDIAKKIIDSGVLGSRSSSQRKGATQSLSAAARRAAERLSKAGREDLLNFNVYWVDRSTRGAAGSGKVWGAVDDLVDWFFRGSGYVEKSVGQHPVFLRVYVQQLERFAHHVRPEDKQRFLSQLYKTLGLDRKGSINFVSRGRRQKEYERISKIVDSSGQGTWSLERLHDTAAKGAADEAKSLFYNARNRTASAQSLIYAFPFGQAWANALVVYMREAAKNPFAPYLAAKTYEALTEEGTGQVYDLLGVDRESGKGLIYENDYGQMVFTVPWLSLGEGTRLTMPLSNLNLATGGGAPLPPPGPIPQGMYAAATATPIWEALPQWARGGIQQYFDPPGTMTSDNAAIRMLPSSLRQIVLGALGYEDVVRNYRQPAQMIELGTGAWTVEGPNGMLVIPDDRKRAFAEAVDSRARNMAVWHGLLRFSLPGSTTMQIYAKTGDGEFATQSAQYAELAALTKTLGDSTVAYQVMASKYGPSNLAITIGNTKDSRYTSPEAWEFAQSNPDAAIQHLDVFGYFFPGEGGSAALTQFYRSMGRNEKMSAEEYANRWNQTQFYMIDSWLDYQVATGVITDSAKSEAIEQFKEDAGVTLSYGGGMSLAQKIDAIRDAAADPALSTAPALPSVQEWLAFRDEMQTVVESRGLKTFTSQRVSDVRTYMLEQGTQMAAQDPAFQVAWERLFKQELMN